MWSTQKSVASGPVDFGVKSDYIGKKTSGRLQNYYSPCDQEFQSNLCIYFSIGGDGNIYNGYYENIPKNQSRKVADCIWLEISVNCYSTAGKKYSVSPQGVSDGLTIWHWG